MTLGSRQKGQDVHIGDGVYASFDGYQIWLAVDHHENKVVALEPKVLESLVRYAIGWGLAAKRLPADDTEGGAA